MPPSQAPPLLWITAKLRHCLPFVLPFPRFAHFIKIIGTPRTVYRNDNRYATPFFPLLCCVKPTQKMHPTIYTRRQQKGPCVLEVRQENMRLFEGGREKETRQKDGRNSFSSSVPRPRRDFFDVTRRGSDSPFPTSATLSPRSCVIYLKPLMSLRAASARFNLSPGKQIYRIACKLRWMNRESFISMTLFSPELLLGDHGATRVWSFAEIIPADLNHLLDLWSYSKMCIFLVSLN